MGKGEAAPNHGRPLQGPHPSSFMGFREAKVLDVWEHPQKRVGTTVALPLTTAQSFWSLRPSTACLQKQTPASTELHWLRTSIRAPSYIPTERLGVGAWILLVHSRQKKKKWGGLINHKTKSLFLLMEQNVPVPETFFSEELLTRAQLVLYL